MTRGQLFDLCQSHLVITIDHRLPAQFPQVLSEVVNKGIIVVYYEYHFLSLLPEWNSLTSPGVVNFLVSNYISTWLSLTNLSLAFILFIVVSLQVPVCCTGTGRFFDTDGICYSIAKEDILARGSMTL